MAAATVTTCSRTTPRRRSLLVALVVGLVWLAPKTAAKGAQDSVRFVVVIHPKVHMASAPTEFVADVFLKRTTRWSDGMYVRPVDLKPTSPVRKRFSESVLKRSVAAVRSYWQQRIFSGRALPPPELESEQAVIDYVSKHPGGVGYVGANTELAGVKVLTLR